MMRYIPIGELCKEIYRYPTYFDIEYVQDGVPEIRGELIGSDGYLSYGDTYRFISRETASKFPRTALEVDDIVMTVRGTLGKVAIVPERLVGGNITANLLRISPDSAKINSKYLWRYMRSEEFLRVLEQASSSTTIKTITMPGLKGINVPCPSLEQQKRIVAVLDKADVLRAKRRKAIEQLDALAQAIFIEMFGDPVTNPMRWGVASCDELCSRVTVGIVVQPASYYQPSGVPALRSLNIKSNKFDLSELVYFSAVDNEALSKTRVWAGDVVVVRSGRPGTAAVVSRELDGVNAIDILIASPKPDLLSGEYLSFFMNSNAGKRLVLGEERGQIQKHLNAGSLKKAEIPVPPIELQEKFVKRLKSLEESKVVLEKSALELDALFSSLQHRAFRGEL